jgi:DNA-binding response OmpR family regulator
MVGEAILQPKESALGVTHPRRILVVDDDQDHLAALTYRLEKLGYEAASASSGEQAINSALSVAPDLVLLDLGLPDVSGLDVCEQLADAATTCTIPVIVVSGMDADEVVRRARSAGCAFYLRKPYDPNVLLLLIESALGSVEELEW